MRGLIVRKTRASLTESALVTFESHVVEEGNSCLNGPTRAHRQSYKYDNGSEIVCGGMDKATRTLSTEYDIIYVPEAIELTEDDWEMLTRPLRHGKMPWQQIIADTNPDKPTHWLKKRCDSAKTRILESRHEENPTLWDMASKTWTPRGADYIAKLDALTGPRKQRLRYGRWVQAEGVVYEEWDAAVHVIDPFPIPDDWPRFWSVDFGFTDPLVIQWWARDPEGRLYLYRELVQTHLLVEDAAREALALSRGEPNPQAIICDHDREGRETLARHLDMDTDPAIKDIETGIEAVAVMLRKAHDGKPRLFVFRDALVSRDPRMEERKAPCGFIEEVDGYIWDLGNSRKKGEQPIDKDNHSADALRYLVRYVTDPQPDYNVITFNLTKGPDMPAPLYFPQIRQAPNSSWYQPRPEIPGVPLQLVDTPAFASQDEAYYFTALLHEMCGRPPLAPGRCPQNLADNEGFASDERQRRAEKRAKVETDAQAYFDRKGLMAYAVKEQPKSQAAPPQQELQTAGTAPNPGRQHHKGR